jgi:hypothetical protein
LAATAVRPDQVKDPVDAALVDPVGQGQAAQVVAGAAAGMEGLGIQEGADLEEGLAVVRERPPVDQRRSCGGIVQAENHAQGRGFAGPVRAEEPRDPSGMDVKAELVHGDGLAVGLGQLPYLDAR